MGKRTVIFLGITTLSLIAWLFSPAVRERYEVEKHIKGLHSNDEEIQLHSVNRLAEFGTKYIPRLIAEYKNQQKLKPDRAYDFTARFSDTRSLNFDYGFIHTLIKLGESAIPFILGELSEDDPRYEGIAIILILLTYGEKEIGKMRGEEQISFVSYQHGEESIDKGKGVFWTDVSFFPKDYLQIRLRTRKQIPVAKSPNQLRLHYSFIHITPSLKPLLEDICNLKSLPYRMVRTRSDVMIFDAKVEITSEKVLRSAEEALKRMKGW